jgi:hypothetical protein
MYMGVFCAVFGVFPLSLQLKTTLVLIKLGGLLQTFLCLVLSSLSKNLLVVNNQCWSLCSSGHQYISPGVSALHGQI